MKKLFQKYRLNLIFTFLGSIAGFLHWHFIGCNSGSCPITSNWYTSILFGGLAGYLIGDILKDIRKKRENK